MVASLHNAGEKIVLERQKLSSILPREKLYYTLMIS